MASAALAAVPSGSTPRFLHQTQLQEGQANTNFRMLDNDLIVLLTSPAARAVTTLLPHIYLRLLSAPYCFQEAHGKLHFAGEPRLVNGQEVNFSGWQQLRELTGVANDTLHKALTFLRETKAIGYYAAPNGVGIRLWLNRAANSVTYQPKAETGRPASARTYLRVVPPPAAPLAPVEAAPLVLDLPPLPETLPLVLDLPPLPETLPLVPDLPPLPETLPPAPGPAPVETPVNPSPSPAPQKNLPAAPVPDGGSPTPFSGTGFKGCKPIEVLEKKLDAPHFGQLELVAHDALCATSTPTEIALLSQNPLPQPGTVLNPPGHVAPAAGEADGAVTSPPLVAHSGLPAQATTAGALTFPLTAPAHTLAPASAPDHPATHTAHTLALAPRPAPQPSPVAPANTLSAPAAAAWLQATASQLQAFCHSLFSRQTALEQELARRTHALASVFDHATRDILRSELHRQQSAHRTELQAWFEEAALPKAVRVALAEAFRFLKREGGFADADARRQAANAVGRQPCPAPDGDPALSAPPVKSAQELATFAEFCRQQALAQGLPCELILSYDTSLTDAQRDQVRAFWHNGHGPFQEPGESLNGHAGSGPAPDAEPNTAQPLTTEELAVCADYLHTTVLLTGEAPHIVLARLGLDPASASALRLLASTPLGPG